MSSEHFDYDLDGWFFFGSLVDSANPDDPGAFFIAVQRIEESSNGFRTPMVPAIVGFNSRSLGKYEFRGFFTIDITSLMTVTSNPWTVKLISPFQSGPLITMSTVSGTMGAADAVYSLIADIPDFNGVRLKANVQLRDRFGTVNQGDGTALMVIEINSATGSLPIAKLFSTDGDMTLNYAHNAKYTWAINNINIEAVPGTIWTSLRSSLDYAMQHRIQLMSADFPADLTITMVRDDQEIYVDKNTIKYEGLATVSGTLGSVAVTGQAFVEIQPVGHLK